MSLLVTKDLVKWFGDTHAVDHVNFTVKESEVLALIGSNGAGKTTLVNLISGLFRPDGGQILFRDADVTHQSVHGRIKAGIARSFQLVNLFDQLTALDNVALTIFSREGKIANLVALAASDSAVWDEAHEILAPVRARRRRRGCWPAASRRASAKLLDVAVAYALRPKLLFLDEPTSGVSTREKAPIMDTVTSIVRSQRHLGGDHRARHGRGLQLLGPDRRDAPGDDPRATARRTRSGATRRSSTNLIGTTETR